LDLSGREASPPTCPIFRIALVHDLAIELFQLPRFTTAASGTQQNSLDALRMSSNTSYFKDKDALWVKVVSTGEGAQGAGPFAGGTSVQVSR
jgi:hypothetical protein